MAQGGFDIRIMRPKLRERLSGRHRGWPSGNWHDLRVSKLPAHPLIRIVDLGTPRSDKES